MADQRLTPKDINQLADRLASFNQWRRGHGEEQPHPAEVGHDIDTAVAILKTTALVLLDE